MQYVVIVPERNSNSLDKEVAREYFVANFRKWNGRVARAAGKSANRMRQVGGTMRERAKNVADGTATLDSEAPAVSGLGERSAAVGHARHARPYRILLVEDHPVVRRGIRAVLESQPGLEICGEFADGTEALEYVKKYKPDLVLMDLTMPGLNGLEATTAVRQESPETGVLVLSMHFSEELAREVLRCGAMGYILKSDPDEELLVAVDHMRRGQPFFTNRLAFAMTQSFVDGASAGAEANSGPASPLTDREVQIVQLLAEGKSNKEVAAALGVSTRTVESHRNHIMHKMNFTSFSHMIRFAVRSNLVEA
jgi:DNA-binding NarL/FixJ family response regulator